MMTQAVHSKISVFCPRDQRIKPVEISISSDHHLESGHHNNQMIRDKIEGYLRKKCGAGFFSLDDNTGITWTLPYNERPSLEFG